MTDNDKRANFRRLAEKRTNVALEAIRKLSNLSNRNNYDFTEEAIERIFDELTEALEDAKATFKPRKRSEFKL